MAERNGSGKATSWTLPKDECLIDTVESFPIVWDSLSKSFKDTGGRDNAWQKIAELVSAALVCSGMNACR